MILLLSSILTTSPWGIQVNPMSKTFSQCHFLSPPRPSQYEHHLLGSCNSFQIGFLASALPPVLCSTARVTWIMKQKSDQIASLLRTLPCLLIAPGLKCRHFAGPQSPKQNPRPPLPSCLPPLSPDSNQTGLFSIPQTHWICSRFKRLTWGISFSCLWSFQSLLKCQLLKEALSDHLY